VELERLRIAIGRSAWRKPRALLPYRAWPRRRLCMANTPGVQKNRARLTAVCDSVGRWPPGQKEGAPAAALAPGSGAISGIP